MDCSKRRLRADARASLSVVTPERAQEWSRGICARLATLPELAGASTLMAFLPLPGEPDPTAAARAWAAAGKRICLPRVNWDAHAMEPVAVTSLTTGLRVTRHGIREPIGGEPIPPADLSAVLVPGLAFDHSCRRLGRGGGFYDRFLAGTPATPIGVCFEVQFAPLLPGEPHDIPMAAVVTERRVIRPGQSRD